MGKHRLEISGFARDALERVLWSFAYGVAAFLVTVGVLDQEAWLGALNAGLITAFTTIKVLAAKNIGDVGTAAIGA